MIVAVGCDHAGFPIHDAVLQAIAEAGHQFMDFGVHTPERVDFPDYAEKACRAILDQKVERAIVMCGSGVGVCITANKIKGIYASVCHDTYSAHQGVEHDHMNVLCLGGRVIGNDLARELVIAFLNAKPIDGPNYIRRVNKIRSIEQHGSIMID
jgi:ribose 5-phosphate isomerase B